MAAPGGVPPAARSAPTAYGFASALPMPEAAPPEAPADPAPRSYPTVYGRATVLPQQSPVAGGLEAAMGTALAGGDVQRALELYASAPDPSALRLDLGQLYDAGCGAARDGKLHLAVSALEIVARRPDAVAGRALVALAQVYETGLADRAQAANLYREALARFPGGKIAEYASEKLRRLA
jgi:hypothetical protein